VTDSSIAISSQAKALSLYIQNAVEHLKNSSTLTANKDQPEQSSLIYLGNWQDPYPRLLVTDPVLEPVDKLAWQIIRLHISAPGAVTAFPNYETIRTYANIKSNHTVARALAILRATRWLSLCARVRDKRGRYLGNIYVLHDEPITLGDAMYLDTEYMTFLNTNTEHNHKRVRKIVENVVATIEEMINDGIDVIGDRTQTWSYERRIGAVTQKQQEPALQLTERTEFYAISDTRINALTQEAPPTQIMHTDEDADSHVQILHTVTESESVQVRNTHTGQAHENTHVQKMHMDQSPENSHVQKMHMDKNTEFDPTQKLHTGTTCSSSNKITTTTKPSSNTSQVREELLFPPNISANERKLAMMYLNPIDEIQQQDVLDEWNGRLSAANRRSTPIENPIGYLASLCKRVKTGEFQITIGVRVRDAREKDKRRKENEIRREKEEQRKQKEMVKTIQANSGSIGNSSIHRRMEQIRKKNTGAKDSQTNE